MLYALTVYNPSPLRWLLFLFCFLGFVLPFAISLQFTKTSFLVAQGALFLLCATLYGSFTRAASPGRTFARIMCVVFLLSLSISIRVESLYLVLALGTPALLHLVYKAWCARGARLFVVLIMGLGSLVVLIDSFGTRGYSQKPEWTNYLEITRLRRSIAEYGSATYYERSKQLFDDIGWSKNDYDMLMDSFWVDPEIYSLENFRKIRNQFPVVDLESIPRLPKVVDFAFNHWSGAHLLWTVVAMASGIALIEIGTRQALVCFGLTAGVVICTLVFFGIFLKLPERIYQPSIMFLCWSALLFSAVPDSLFEKRSWVQPRTLLGLASIALSVLLIGLSENTPLRRNLNVGQSRLQDNGALRESLLRLQPRKEQIFLTWGAQFPYEHILPFEGREYLEEFRPIGIGAGNQSPMQTEMLGKQGIVDVYRALFEREDVFITVRPDSTRATLLKNYLRQHYGVDTRVAEYFDDGVLFFGRVVLVSRD